VADDIEAAMVTLHAKTGCPPSEQVRRALRAWLTRQGVYTPPKKEKKR
jgi:hypothetical protein